MSEDQRKAAEGEAKIDAKRRILPEAARRALAEAEERRLTAREKEANLPREVGGRGGLEPGRYGDWEIKGLTSDF